MSSKTISLEKSAFERLKAAKRPDESYTDVVNRLLAGREPRFSDFAGLLDKKTSDKLYDTFHRMRREDLEVERERQRRWR